MRRKEHMGMEAAAVASMRVAAVEQAEARALLLSWRTAGACRPGQAWAWGRGRLAGAVHGGVARCLGQMRGSLRAAARGCCHP